MSTLDQKATIDCEYIVNFINNHENKNGIVSMFIKGPPPNDGFMWCGREGGDGQYWTLDEARGLKVIGNLVLEGYLQIGLLIIYNQLLIGIFRLRIRLK